MKAYTDIEQSKALAKILPIKSADMFWMHVEEKSPKIDFWKVETIQRNFKPYSMDIPCWSLAALLDQLEDTIYDEDGNAYELVIKKEGVQYDIYYLDVYGEQENIELDRFYDNLIDCCYEMILKLKEKELI